MYWLFKVWGVPRQMIYPQIVKTSSGLGQEPASKVRVLRRVLPLVPTLHRMADDIIPVPKVLVVPHQQLEPPPARPMAYFSPIQGLVYIVVAR